MKFDIVTYCSRSYVDAFEKNIPSWINNTSAEKIVVYTDTMKLTPKPKVVINKFFNPCDNWITNVGRKTKCILNYLNNDPAEYFAFIEIDCYIRNDFPEVFHENVDLSVTRIFSKEQYTHATLTCGVWFAKSSENIHQLMKQWHTLSRKYKKLKIGVVPRLIAYDQLSFTDLVRPAFVNKTMRINAIDEKIYNSEHSNIETWIEKIKDVTPKILHFKGQRFRDCELVNTILTAAEISEKENKQ